MYQAAVQIAIQRTCQVQCLNAHPSNWFPLINQLIQKINIITYQGNKATHARKHGKQKTNDNEDED